MDTEDKLKSIYQWGFRIQLSGTSYGMTYLDLYRAPGAVPRFQKTCDTRDDAIDYAYNKVNMLIWESVAFWTRRGFIGPNK